MKKLLIILPLLVACKSSKNANCDAYGAVYVEQDTIVLTTEHINLNGRCSTDTTMITYMTDTFRIPKQR
jgi:hypothetical protein